MHPHTGGGPASTHPSSKLRNCKRQVGGSRPEACGRSVQRGLLGRGGLAQYGRGTACAEGTALRASQRRRGGAGARGRGSAGAQGRALYRQPRGGARSPAAQLVVGVGGCAGGFLGPLLSSSLALLGAFSRREAHDSRVVSPERAQPSPRPGTRPQFLPWQAGTFPSAIPPSTADTTAQPTRRERPLQSFPGKSRPPHGGGWPVCCESRQAFPAGARILGRALARAPRRY